MSLPAVAPSKREKLDIAPADQYSEGERVWVHVDEQWRPGFVEIVSIHAATVTYQTSDMRTEVVIRTAPYLSAREEDNLFIDLVVACV